MCVAECRWDPDKLKAILSESNFNSKALQQFKNITYADNKDDILACALPRHVDARRVPDDVIAAEAIRWIFKFQIATAQMHIATRTTNSKIVGGMPPIFFTIV